jgi:hypothetical protein
MSPVVWLMANTMWYPQDGGGGGHFWVYLNWARLAGPRLPRILV